MNYGKSQKPHKLLMLACILLSSLVATPEVKAANQAWSIVPSPNSGPGNNYLRAVAAVSNNDAWAVGYRDDEAAGTTRTLIQHWNGTVWEVVGSPNVGSGSNYLYGVAAAFSDGAWHIWAVGYYTDAGGVEQTLTLRWNGSVWEHIPSPNRSGNNRLVSVAVVNGNQVWAVGYSGSANLHQTMTMRWDGTQWSIVSSPNPPPFQTGAADTYLTGVSATSVGDAKAVGYYYNADRSRRLTLILHWDRQANEWLIVSSPNVEGSGDNVLNAITVITTDLDARAVGFYIDATGNRRTLTLHWNGTQWSVVPSPNIPYPYNTYYNELNAVATVSANHVWAVGEYDAPPLSTLTMRWDGTQWSIVPSPNQPGANNYLYGIDTTGGGCDNTTIWAVGDYLSGSVHRTLILEYTIPAPCNQNP